MPLGNDQTSATSTGDYVEHESHDVDRFQPVPPRKRNRTSYIKHALTNARTSRMIGSQAPSAYSNKGPSTLASQFDRSNIYQQPNHNSTPYNPSLGPCSSAAPSSRKRSRPCSSYNSNGSIRQREQNTKPPPLYKFGRYSRRDFRHGHILSLPFHTPNLNPNVDPFDRRLTQTCEGPAYSKRRMFVVLFMHYRDLFCLPLYTFNGTGLKGKNEDLRYEYVCMKNQGEEHFANQGPNSVVEADCGPRGLDVNTCVHLTGGIRVDCCEDIRISGRMPYDSFYKLLDLWKGETRRAQHERWIDAW